MKWFNDVGRSQRIALSDQRSLLGDADFGAGVWDTPLDEASYFVIDIETSGFSAAADTVLSLAAGCMQGDDPRLEPTLYELIRPDDVTAIPEAVWALTGLSPGALQAGSGLREVLFNALSMSVNRVWIAHHAKHEVSFLQRYTRRLWKIPLRPIVIDTSVVARALWGLSEVPTLEVVCRSLDVPVEGRHQADADVEMTAQVWTREMAMCRRLGLTTVSEVVEWATLRAWS